MPKFDCTVCGTDFSVSQAALDKYAGWTPKYCRQHSPKKGGSTTNGAAKRPGRPKDGPSEMLRLHEVLERYHDGPSDGIFTDGSCKPNPGPGGWGLVWVSRGEILFQDHGHEPQTTNNRMEMIALIEALKLCPADARVTLFSDSQLCVKTLNEWAKGWAAKGWKKKTGPIKNLDLVQEAWSLKQARPLATVSWVAAHAGNRWNEYADSLSTAWMREAL